jgi:hypothetical protein
MSAIVEQIVNESFVVEVFDNQVFYPGLGQHEPHYKWKSDYEEQAFAPVTAALFPL